MKSLTVNYSRLWRSLASILLFLMIWTTGKFMAIKLVLCFACVVVGCIRGFQKIAINKSMLRWVLLYLLFNAFYMLLSLVNGNQSIIGLVGVRIIEPIIYFILLSLVRPHDYLHLKNLLVYYSTFLYVYIIIAFLVINHILPTGLEQLPLITVDIGGVLPFGLKKPDAQFIQWLYFLTPLNISLLFMRKKLKSKTIRFFVVCNAVLGIVVALITLKTAMLLVVALSYILSAILVYIYYDHMKIGVKGIAIIVAVIAIVSCCCLVPSVNAYFQNTVIQKLRTSFGVAESYKNSMGVVDGGSSLRMEQLEDLIATWKDRPILGWGDGANARKVIRSNVSGSYELVYIAKLMQRGIIGWLIYVLLFAWVYIHLFRFVRHKHQVHIEAYALIVGLSGILFANGTNPYLESFDKLIIIFLPLVVIRMDRLLTRSSFRQSSNMLDIHG